jgi:hypothetical protein
MNAPSRKNSQHIAVFSLLSAPMAQIAMIRFAEGFQFFTKALNSLLCLLSGNAAPCHFTIHRVIRSVLASIVLR